MLFRIEYIGICYNWINMDSHTRILEKTEYARSYIIMEIIHARDVPFTVQSYELNNCGYIKKPRINAYRFITFL